MRDKLLEILSFIWYAFLGILGIAFMVFLSASFAGQESGEYREIQEARREDQELRAELGYSSTQTHTSLEPANAPVGATADASLAMAADLAATTSLPADSEAPRPVNGIIEIPASLPSNTVPVQVLSVTDGDTIRVDYNGTNTPLRYTGIDTPERDEQFFNEATTYNWRIVAGQTVYLEKDVSERDRYDRLLRYIWLEDGRLVNEELVRAGWALSSTYPPDVKYQQAFLAAQKDALEAGNGFWGDGELINPVRSAPATSPTASPAPRRTVSTSPTCNTGSNFRGGPGTNYPRVGGCKAGDVLNISGRNQAGDWLQLSSGAWIFASLVDNAPSGPNIVQAPAPPAAAPAPTIAPARNLQAQPSNCHPSYSVCIPPPPPDLDCRDIGYRRLRVSGSDPHNFDGDFDGIGCEGG
jgi:micrococcal nuclease